MITIGSRLKITVAFLTLFLVAAALLPLTAEAAVVTITEYTGLTDSSGPWGITSGPDGALWFTEQTGNQIGRIDPATHIVTEYPVLTTGSQPQGITSGSDGALWFTEYTGNRIGRIDPATHIVTEYPVLTTGSGPYAITTGSDGALWFTEQNVNKIGRITIGGAVTEYEGLTTGSVPYGITSGPDGALWFTEYEGNRIGRIHPVTHVVTEYEGLTAGSNPWQITSGPDGALWFTERNGNRIGRITTGGAVTEHTGLTTNSQPNGITSGPDGALWFTETTRNQIGRLDPTTDVVTEYAGLTLASRPYGITSGPDEALWFAQSQASHIGRVSIVFTITASVSGGHGTISPSGAVSVNAGADQAFTVTPDEHYRIKKITVDGSDVIPPVSPYTFTNVTADHIITAEFEMKTHSITLTQGEHGSITPAGTGGVVTVNDGANQTFTMTSDPLYHVADVLVDGSSVGPVTSYTFNNVERNHTITATFASNSSTWYLAEGTTAWGFSTYISIQNPNDSEVDAKVTYMPKGNSNVTENVSLPANSQTTLTNDHLTEKMGGQTDFSTKVECTQGKPIAVDRTMSWTGAGAASPEAHSSVGVTSPAKTWYLPEGSTNWGFETWLLIQNPNGTKATCKVTYMIEGESPLTKTKEVPANSRETYSMFEDIGNKDASIKVESDIPVIPERAMYRNNRREGHDSIGTTSPASDFYLAEGTTAWGFTTYVLVQNPNDEATDVTITYMTPSGQQPGGSFNMSGNSRKTVRVNGVPGMGNTDLSTAVHGSRPIIAERAMYWDNGTCEACHDSIGMDSPHMTFYLPDGETGSDVETWTLVQNPNTSPVTVDITYLTPSGIGNVTRPETIPANSRVTFGMQAHSHLTSRAAIMVTSKTSGKKIIVERAMYWNGKGAGTDTIGGFAD